MLTHSTKPLSVDDITREIRTKLGSPPSTYAGNLLATALRFANSQSQKSVDLQDILKLDGKEFLIAAYLIVLGRSIDPEGLRTYLEELEAGTSKIIILGHLRYSEEGERSGKTIKGLRESYRAHKIRRKFKLKNLLRIVSLPLRILGKNRRPQQAEQTTADQSQTHKFTQGVSTKIIKVLKWWSSKILQPNN